MRVMSRAATCRISSPVMPFGSGTGDPWRTLFSLSLANSPQPARPSLNVPCSPLPLPPLLPSAAVSPAGSLLAPAPSLDGPLRGDCATPPPSPPAVIMREGGQNLPPSMTPSIRLLSVTLPPRCIGREAGGCGWDGGAGWSAGRLPSSEGLWLCRGRGDTAFRPSAIAALGSIWPFWERTCAIPPPPLPPTSCGGLCRGGGLRPVCWGEYGAPLVAATSSDRAGVTADAESALRHESRERHHIYAEERELWILVFTRRRV